MRIQKIVAGMVRIFGAGMLASLAAISVATCGTLLGMFSNADLQIADLQAILASKPTSGQTVIIGIDQETLARCGGLPIGRDLYADVLDNLEAAGVGRIFIDKSVATPSNAEHDARFEESLKKIGADRVALPLMTLKGNRRSDGTYPAVRLEALPRFSQHTSVVSIDLQYDYHGLIRSVGRTAFGEVAEQPTASAWLAAGQNATPGICDVDIRLEVDSIPVVSFMEVLNKDPNALDAVKGKNVVIGMIAERVIQSIAVPRYGEIERAPFVALAAETMTMGSQPVKASLWTVLLGTALAVLPLGRLLPKCGILIGGLVTLLALVLLFSLGVVLQRQTNLVLPSLLPLGAILMTYAGTLVATHPSFAQTRQAAVSLLGKFDYGLARLFHSGVDSIITFSPEGNILTVNETAEKLFGIKAEAVIGKPLATVLPDAAETLLKAASGHQPGRLEATVEGKAGVSRHVDLAFNAMPSETGWVGYASIRDISVIRAREDELKRQATHDAMTGLPNRVAFERHLDATLRFATETNRPFAVFLLDLNKFKQVNDTLGHHVGDALLIEVARRFKKVIRSSDFVCRLGGDEFAAVISPATARDSAENIAAAMVQAIADLTELDGHAIDTGTSIGIAYYPEHATTAEELIRLADEAMYGAKRGKHGYCVANPEPSLVCH